MHKNLKIAGKHEQAEQTSARLDYQNTAQNDEPTDRPLLAELLAEVISAGCDEVHLEQDAGLCRLRKRSNGQLDERRIESPTLTTDLIKELTSDAPTAGERTLAIKAANCDCLLEYVFYPTSAGQNLTIKIHREHKLPGTLDQTSLSAQQIQSLRSHATGTASGLTIITATDSDLLQAMYYGFLGEANCVEKKIVSIERINRKRIPRINHIALAVLEDPDTVTRVAIKHANQLFIDSMCTNDSELIKKAINSNLPVTLFIKAANTTRAIAQLTDVVPNERQLASNLTTLIQLHNTRLVCPDCANSHEPNGSDMQWLQDKPMAKNTSNTLVYAPGCDRCEFSGSRSTQTLLSICAVEDNLRAAIESRSAASVDKATNACLRKNSIAEQIDVLVSQGKVSFTEYKAS